MLIDILVLLNFSLKLLFSFFREVEREEMSEKKEESKEKGTPSLADVWASVSRSFSCENMSRRSDIPQLQNASNEERLKWWKEEMRRKVIPVTKYVFGRAGLLGVVWGVRR